MFGFLFKTNKETDENRSQIFITKKRIKSELKTLYEKIKKDFTEKDD